MNRIENLRAVLEAESASFKEVSGLKMEQDVIERMEWDLAYVPSPVDNGNSVAIETLAIAHEGILLV